MKDDSIQLKINNMLDIMWRLKEKETLPQKQMFNLEGAYYMCRPHLAVHKNATQLLFARKGDNLSLVQQYIQHLLLERIPLAHNYHAKLIAVGPQKPQTDEEETQISSEPQVSLDDKKVEQSSEQTAEPSEFVPKNSIDTVIELILKLPWRDHEDFIFR